VLGGRAMAIVYTRGEMEAYIHLAVEAARDLRGAKRNFCEVLGARVEPKMIEKHASVQENGLAQRPKHREETLQPRCFDVVAQDRVDRPWAVAAGRLVIDARPWLTFKGILR